MNKTIITHKNSKDAKKNAKDIGLGNTVRKPEIYNMQGNSGFKTPLKIVSGNPKMLKEYNSGRPVTLRQLPPTDYKFDIRKSVKSYGLPIVSLYPNVFQVDIMDKRRIDDYVYLVAININNRYGYVIPLNVDENEDMYFIPNSAKDKHAVVNAFTELIKQINSSGKTVVFETDAERSFQSDYVGDFMRQNNIKLVGKVDKAHTRLAIVDRFIRTLRDMAYVKFQVKHNIDPVQMRDIVEEYNQSFHLGLSKVAFMNVSPAIVQQDRELEAMIVRRQLTKVHDTLLDSNIPIGSYVIVHSQALEINGLLPFKEKKRYTTLPGDWVVIGREGAKYVVSDEQNTLVVPRWMIKLML
jgi:hypothetical protein